METTSTTNNWMYHHQICYEKTQCHGSNSYPKSNPWMVPDLGITGSLPQSHSRQIVPFMPLPQRNSWTPNLMWQSQPTENSTTILSQMFSAVHNQQYQSSLITNVVAWYDIYQLKHLLLQLLSSTIPSHIPQPSIDQMEATLLQPNFKTVDPLCQSEPTQTRCHSILCQSPSLCLGKCPQTMGIM